MIGKRLKYYKLSKFEQDDREVDFLNKNPQLRMFNFRAFFNTPMLLSKSEKAKQLSSVILEIILDTINNRTGGGPKYINLRDEE